MRSREDLHKYQEKTVQFIKDKKRCLLALFMGAGKTCTSLTAIADLSDSFEVRSTLVIAPLRVANSVWSQEALNWKHTKHLKVSVCTGNEKQRLQALMRTADVYVTNRENVEWLVKNQRKWKFDCVIIDESDSFKSGSSKRFKALKKVIPDTEYMILLSGTPAVNGLLDLWAQMYLIDFGERLGRTMTAYKQRFFEADYMGYKFTPRKGSAEKIHELLSDKVLSMSAEDYLELPDKIYLTEKVTFPDKLLKQYQEFEKELFAEFDGEEVEALSAATLAGKLLQFCNGAMYHDEHKNFVELHSLKLEALEEIIEDNKGETILVAYNYQHDLSRLKARFPSAVVLDKEQSTIDRWNRGEIPLLLAHPQSASHGINLQHGGCLCVWFGLTWSLGQYLQFNARLHRQGQTRPVRIIHLIAEGTIDERVMTVLGEKDAVQNNLLKALKSA